MGRARCRSLFICRESCHDSPSVGLCLAPGAAKPSATSRQKTIYDAEGCEWGGDFAMVKDATKRKRGGSAGSVSEAFGPRESGIRDQAKKAVWNEEGRSLTTRTTNASLAL